MRVTSIGFQVIGVLARRGMTPEGQDLDDVAVIPIDAYRQKIARGLASRFDGVLLIAPGSERVEADVRKLLRERHLLGTGDDDDFVLRAVNR